MAQLDWRVYEGCVPARADALAFNIEQCCKSSRQRTDPATLEEWRERVPQLRHSLLEALGLMPLPKRTPLKAKVVGRTERDDYRIENVVFQSRPRFYVTANLYLPKGVQFPTAGVVVTMGHAMKEGKNYALYQAGQVALVRQGFVVLGYDPIGQGERQRPGMSHLLGYGSLLVGQTNEGMMVWDTIRALDYLCTRKEVDPSRLGITGNSGGGENTFYTMPVDDRLKAAASNCFVCSYEEWIRHGGNHCICNHLPGMARRMEEFEIIGLDAPRAFLILSGAKDPIFPLRGVRQTARRIKHLYALAGFANRVREVDFPLPHGWARPLREASVGWLAHYLLGRGSGGPLPEKPFTPVKSNAKELLCFKDGKFPADAETVVTLNRALAEKLTGVYARPPRTGRVWHDTAQQMRRSLWDVLGGKPEPFATRMTRHGSFTWHGSQVDKVSYATEPGLEVPALLLRSQRAASSGTAVLFVDENHKTAVREEVWLAEALAAGALVCALDPRGLGEVHCHANHLASDCIHLGRPLFGQQLWDVLQVARRLVKEAGVDRVVCFGRSAAGLLALFAGALGDDVTAVVAAGSLASYEYALENSQPQPLFVFTPNLLKVADVPQVIALCAPKPTVIWNAVGYGRKPLPRAAVATEFEFARRVFELSRAADRLHVLTGKRSSVSRTVSAVLLGK